MEPASWRVASPCGAWELVLEGEAVVRCAAVEGGPYRVGPAAVEAVRAYLAGELDALDAVARAPRGTPFQRAVWETVRRIAPGQTWTYAQVAAALGRGPEAARAVGAAVGANPLLLFVPCHRVVGTDGDLTGYAGGVARKRWLLAHEGPQLPLLR